jgi:hypothetical protein
MESFMSELKEKINLPIIGGELVARFIPGRVYGYTPEQKTDRFIWEIRIVVRGPNARYNSGEAIISEEALPKLIDTITNALTKVRALQEISFSGEFSKTYDTFHNPTVEIKATSGNINVLFWISNNTKWRFARTLNENQLSQLLEILKTIEHRGDNLLESLKIIHA